jgi:hypothetical protein
MNTAGKMYTAGFVYYRANNGSWRVVPATGHGFGGYGYGVRKSYPRVTRAEPYPSEFIANFIHQMHSLKPIATFETRSFRFCHHRSFSISEVSISESAETSLRNLSNA